MAVGAAIGLAVAGIAGAGISLYGANKQAKALESSGAMNSMFSLYNAVVNRQRAVDAVARGRKAADEHRIGVKGLVGTQRAAFAAQGVLVDEGSPEQVQLDTLTLGELDARKIENNAIEEAFGLIAGASNQVIGGQMNLRTTQQQAAGVRISGVGQAVSQVGQSTAGIGQVGMQAGWFQG